MGVGQGISTLQQLQQQLLNPAFAQQSMAGLQGAGLGPTNPQSFFSTPLDEQILRQAVMGRVLGRYGVNPGQFGGVGNPAQLNPSRVDPYTGSPTLPNWAGFDSKKDWKMAGRPEQTLGQIGDGGTMQIQPFLGGSIPQMDAGGFTPPGSETTLGGGMQIDPNFYGKMQGYNPNIPALNTDYGSMITNAFQGIYGNQGGGGGFTPGGSGMPQGGFGGGFQAGQFPSLDQNSLNSLNAITQGQLGAVNNDFNNQKQDLINQLFGKGMNQSSVAADAGGKLLYGRQDALNQIYGQAGQREMDARKALLDQQTALIKAGATGGLGGFGGGGGGGIIPAGGMTQGYAPQDFTNLLAGQLGRAGGIPLSFEQQMQLADMQLKQAGLQQQGQLGFGGLGLQQQLGLGQQGLQGQQLDQSFLDQILGQGLSRQQGAAGMSQADLARMQQYLMGQQGLAAQLGGQQAQLQAQQQPFWQKALLGALGGASSLFSGMATGGTGFFRP